MNGRWNVATYIISWKCVQLIVIVKNCWISVCHWPAHPSRGWDRASYACERERSEACEGDRHNEPLKIMTRFKRRYLENGWTYRGDRNGDLKRKFPRFQHRRPNEECPNSFDAMFIQSFKNFNTLYRYIWQILQWIFILFQIIIIIIHSLIQLVQQLRHTDTNNNCIFK